MEEADIGPFLAFLDITLLIILRGVCQCWLAGVSRSLALTDLVQRSRHP